MIANDGEKKEYLLNSETIPNKLQKWKFEQFCNELNFNLVQFMTWVQVHMFSKDSFKVKAGATTSNVEDKISPNQVWHDLR